MALASQTKTIVGVFNSVNDAHSAVRELEAQGISRNDISVVANKNAVGYESLERTGDRASDVVADAGIGAAIGGVGGILLSAAGAITMPVIGPILAAGPIAAALTGAGIGAAAGGLIGALTESGIPEEQAKYYAEGVRRGDILVTVKATEAQAERVSNVLDRYNAVDVDERVSSWKTRGWGGYSETATPLQEDELREERRYYSTNYPATSTTAYRDTASTTSSTAGSTSGSTPGSAMGEKAREMGREVKEWGQDVADKARDAGRKISEETRELKDDARENARRMENTIRDEDAERRRRSRVYDRGNF